MGIKRTGSPDHAKPVESGPMEVDQQSPKMNAQKRGYRLLPLQLMNVNATTHLKELSLEALHDLRKPQLMDLVASA